ncbi:MAG: chloride channel protein [Actinobacteria bacterium]|nr:chloride channel protein [Actinomycetota bacterium]
MRYIKSNGRHLPEDDVIGPDLREHGPEEELGDFTMRVSHLARMIPLAVVVAVVASFVALLLLDLIALVTNLAYRGVASTNLVSPAHHHRGAFAIAIPVIGGLVIGLVARFGSERIRGHGIPEAMETILVGGSNVEPRVTILKPLSSAISIGTGGPFGAEGPIILTGGGVGSVLGQFFHMSAMERRCLLVAGAAAGMSAVFGTPVAAVDLGIELLVFEMKPRSMIPIAIASAVADAVRVAFAHQGWIAPEPLFPVTTVMRAGTASILGAMLVGIVGGAAAFVFTKAVYGAEDAFKRLPIHWMWWPALGGIVIGVGGLIQPRALGVGYDTLGAELAGKLAVATLVGVLVVKLAIWAIALGSGTSGGILAPILIMGAALGGLLGHVLPGAAPAWAVIGMTAALAGVMRSPLTSIVFSLELTHNVNLLLPILFAATIAHAVSVLVLKRSILTEKVARRGFHVLREYAVGPLEALFVRDVMRTDLVTVSLEHSIADVYAVLRVRASLREQGTLPVLHEDRVAGALPWIDVLQLTAEDDVAGCVRDLMHGDPVVAYPDESLRVVADRMAQHHVGSLVVVDREREGELRGVVTRADVLGARGRLLHEERHRERVLRVRPVLKRDAS